MDEQRAEFETAYRQEFGKRWMCPQRQDMFKLEINRYAHLSVQDMWVMWQAATQRQQERIAELEADIAHKDAYAEQLGRLLFKAGAERQELEAQVQALSLDAGRLDWLTFHLSGKALRDIGVIWSEHADARAAIDAAIAAGKGDV